MAVGVSLQGETCQGFEPSSEAVTGQGHRNSDAEMMGVTGELLLSAPLSEAGPTPGVLSVRQLQAAAAQSAHGPGMFDGLL